MHDSFFVSNTLHEREIELADGSKYVLHFKELPANDFRKFYFSTQSKDDDVRSAAVCKLISMSLCNPDGKPAMTLEKAAQLKPGVEKAIFDALMSVNGMASGNA